MEFAVTHDGVAYYTKLETILPESQLRERSAVVHSP